MKATDHTIMPKTALAKGASTYESWSAKYNISLGTLVDNKVARVISAVSGNCVDDLGGKLDAVAAEKPLKDKFLSYNPATQPPWGSFMTANSVSKLPYGVPAFIAQGKSDQIVRRDVTRQFVQAQCAAGIAIKYLTLDGMDHGGTAKASSGPAIAWIGDRFAGKTAPSSCD